MLANQTSAAWALDGGGGGDGGGTAAAKPSRPQPGYLVVDGVVKLLCGCAIAILLERILDLLLSLPPRELDVLRVRIVTCPPHIDHIAGPLQRKVSTVNHERIPIMREALRFPLVRM